MVYYQFWVLCKGCTFIQIQQLNGKSTNPLQSTQNPVRHSDKDYIPEECFWHWQSLHGLYM